MLRDMESGKQIYVDPVAAKKTYDERFQKHRAQLIDLCHRRAARLETVDTSRPLEHALFDLVGRMM